MSKWEKLLGKITELSKDLKFAELKRILESYGYEGRKPGSGSSHWTFRKQGKSPITIPENEPIKIVYVRIIKDIIESEEE
ncbi:MAG: toxin HicA [Firmicutes bacterium HGW-Firmicutes-12]|nr:MAG: toxin HicA [Firmicutes bacterium HGW-Firmicutes-12]